MKISSRIKYATDAALAAEAVNGTDLSIPPALDRTVGMTKEQIEAQRDKAIKNANKQTKPAARGVTSPSPRPSNLTDADKAAIAKLKKEQAAEKATKTEKRINKLRAAKGLEPVKIKPKADKADKKAKPAKAAKSNAKREDRKAKIAIIVKALKRKDGITNAEQIELVGFRMNVEPLREAAKAAGIKLKVVKKEGEPTRYMSA